MTPRSLCVIGCLCLAALTLAASLTAAEQATTPSLVRSAAPDWPQWRGPHRDGISPETGLLQSWPNGGPKLLWQVSGIGQGYSSPIVVADRVYITGDQDKELAISHGTATLCLACVVGSGIGVALFQSSQHIGRGYSAARTVFSQHLRCYPVFSAHRVVQNLTRWGITTEKTLHRTISPCGFTRKVSRRFF